MTPRLLVWAPNPVGDLVMATASFADVRRALPGAHIALVVKPGREALVAGTPDVDEVLIDESFRGLSALRRFARSLGQMRFDLCLLFPNSLRVALVAWLARIPARVGYRKGGRGLLLTRPVEAEKAGGKWKPVAMPALYARLLRAAGIEAGDGRPRLVVTAREEEEAGRRRAELGIGAGEELIGLVPGAGFGASKLWPASHFARLGDLLTERFGLRTIIFAAPGEEAIAGELTSRMRTAPINTASLPLGLGLLKPFIRDLRLLITTDTGPRHYAAAFGVPQVVVMGPTDPRWTAANLERSEVVRREVPCGPCQLPVCPLDHRCLEGITAEEVLARVEELDRRLGVFRKSSAAGTGRSS